MNKTKEIKKHINDSRIVAFLKLILKTHMLVFKIATYLSSIFFSVWFVVVSLWLLFGGVDNYSRIVDIYLSLTVSISVAAVIIFWQPKINAKKKKTKNLVINNILLFIALFFVFFFVAIKSEGIISIHVFPIALIAFLIRAQLKNNRNIIDNAKKIFFALGSFIYLILISVSLLGISNILIDKFNYLIKGAELLLSKGLVGSLMMILIFYLFFIFFVYYLIFVAKHTLKKKEEKKPSNYNRAIFMVLFLGGISFIFFLFMFALGLIMNSIPLYDFIIKYLGWFIAPSLVYFHANYLIYDFFGIKKFK